MLTARMSASENPCSPAPCEQGSCQATGTAPSVRACVSVCLHTGSVRPRAIVTHCPPPAVSGPPQLASQFSGRQLSPRCFSLPAWLRAVRVCVYFGQPPK